MGSTRRETWTTLEPQGNHTVVPGVFTELELAARMLELQVDPSSGAEGQLRYGTDPDDLSPTLRSGTMSDDPDDDEEEEEERNLLAAHQNLKRDYAQLEDRNKNIIRQFRDAKIDLKKYKEENVQLQENHKDDLRLLETLKRELEKSEKEKERLRLENHRVYTNEEYFKSQMAFVQTNKYIRILDFLESTNMFGALQELRNCKIIHENALEAIRDTLRTMSVNLDKDNKFEFLLPEGLSELAFLKLENSLKEWTNKIGSRAVPMQTPSFGQPFQPDFSPLPHKNNDIFGDDIFRNPHQGNEFSNSVMKPIGTGKPSHSVAAISPDLRNSFQDIMNPTVSHFNASVQGATVAKAFPIHLPPPNVRMFNVPPPPLHQMPPAVEPIQPEPMSGAMFFANIQSRLMTNNHPQNQNPNPSSEPSSGDSVQFKVIEEGKKKWPFMSQEKILEGLNKLRERKVKSGDVDLLLLLLDNLFEEERAKGPSFGSINQNDDSPECPICLTVVDISELYTTPCGHKFHTSCVGEWLQEKRECPCCRRLVLQHEEFPSLATATRRKRFM